MSRPRWHDVLIVASIVGILGLGVRVLWWENVCSFMGWSSGSAAETMPAPPSQT